MKAHEFQRFPVELLSLRTQQRFEHGFAQIEKRVFIFVSFFVFFAEAYRVELVSEGDVDDHYSSLYPPLL